MTITISSPEDLLAALPYQVGFHPRESLVVVVLREHTICFSARLDIPREPADALDLIDATCERIAWATSQAGGDGALLVLYDDTPLGWGTLLAVGDRLSSWGLRMPLSALVAGGSWRQLGSDEPLHWGTWHPMPRADESGAVAEFVGLGRSAAPDRETSLDLLRPTPGPDGMMARVTGREARIPVLATGAWRRFFTLGAVDEPDFWWPDSATAVAMGRSLLDREFRDALIALLVPDSVPLDALVPGALVRAQDLLGRALEPPRAGCGEPSWQRQASTHAAVERIFFRFATLSRMCPPPISAGAYCVTALLAGRLGRGHLCSAAIDEALAADPQHVLAGLLHRALGRGMLPGHAVAGQAPGAGVA